MDRYIVVRYFIVPEENVDSALSLSSFLINKANIEKEQKVVLIIIYTAQSFLYNKIHFFVFFSVIHNRTS